MKVFVTRWFARFARQEEIADASLVEAIERAERGQIDADLGGGLIKQRVARKGKGRSGGYRVIIAYRAHGRAVFLIGFAKNEQENIRNDELIHLREVAKNWLNADALKMQKEMAVGNLKEVPDGKEAE